MRNLLIYFALSLISLASSAQAHLKFMGVPIDGTITSFSSKLQSKGLKLAPYNSEVPVGIRAFNGVFHGTSADFYVSYNPKTKIVYKVSVYIDSKELSFVKKHFYDIQISIENKYNTETVNSERDGYPIAINKIDLGNKDKYAGSIDLSITYEDGRYSLLILYEDIINSEINDSLLDEDI